MIVLPKHRGMPDPQRPINAGQFRIKGEARVVLYDENLNELYDSGFFPNLIVNNGLDLLGRGPFSINYRTYIGDNATAADVNQTAMLGFLAQSGSSGASGTFDLGSAPDYEYFLDTSKRFAAGVGTGTVREIGMGMSDNDTGTNITNRVVLGTPVDKAANQVLDVFFRFTVWPPVIDVIGVSTIEGVAYNTITRGKNYPNWSGSGAPMYSMVKFPSGLSGYHSYSGNIGLITADPDGTHDDLQGDGAASAPTYVDGEYARSVTAFAGLAAWNVGGLIRSLACSIDQFQWQTQFGVDPGATGNAIPKAVTEIFDFTWRVTWARHV